MKGQPTIYIYFMHSYHINFFLKFFDISKPQDSSESFFKLSQIKKFSNILIEKICNISGPAQFKPVLSKGQLYIKYVGFLVCLESLLLRLPSPGGCSQPRD